MSSDVIGNMLTTLRNASSNGKKYASIPASKLKIEIVQVLESQGFVSGFRLLRDAGQGKIKVALKYTSTGSPALKGIARVSKPGCRVYSAASDLDKYASVKVSIVTTPKGVFSSAEAKKMGIGGEIIASVW
jgi:small subunit ribosomal protein S8